MSWLQRLSARILGEHTYVNAALADQALVSGTNFLTAILLARFLGPEEFGRYMIVWFAVFLAQNMQRALVNAPMMTLSVTWPDADRAKSFGAVFQHQLALCAFTAFLVYAIFLVADIFVPDWKLGTLALPGALLAAAVQGPDMFRTYNFVRDHGWRSVGIDALRTALQIGGVGALFIWLPTHSSVATALWVMVGANLAPLALCFLWLGPYAFDRDVLQKTTLHHWRFSRWILATAVARSGQESFASIIVGAVLGLTEVGILRAAQQLVYAINVPLQALGNVIPVHASRAFQDKGWPGLRTFVKSFAIKFMLPMAIFLGVIGALGEPLLKGIYGETYQGYGYVVALYAGVMTIYLLKDALLMVFRAMQRTDIEFYANMFAVVIGVLSAYPLVLAFGIVGALLAEAVFIIGVICFGWHRLKRSQSEASNQSSHVNQTTQAKT